jgi:hypothetical protein
VDKNGNAVVVFMYGGEIAANRYDYAGDGWSTLGAIDTRAGAAQEPTIAVDGSGNFLAVWAQDPNASLQGIWQSTSADGTNWGPVTAITRTQAWGPVISMNANGAAIVAWTESDATTQNWQVAAVTRTATGAGWSGPQVLRPGDDNGDRNPAVAMSGTGEAFAIWEQSEGNPAVDAISVWFRQRTATGWGPATLFETYDAGPCYGQAIAANTSGQAMGTFLQVGTDGTMKMLSRRYTPGAGFSTNVLQVNIATTIEFLIYPSLTLDDAGIATVAYSVAQSSGKYDVYASRSGTGDNAWPAATMIESDDAATADDPNDSLARVPMPVVGHDPSGNVTLVWRKRTGTRFDAYARRYSGGSWGATSTSTLLETRDANSVFFPAVGVGANGTAVAVWYYGNELTVWGNVFR